MRDFGGLQAFTNQLCALLQGWIFRGIIVLSPCPIKSVRKTIVMREHGLLVRIFSLFLLFASAAQALSQELTPFTHTAFVEVGEHPAAVIAGDFDGDGDFDVVSANDGDGEGRTITLLENDGDARFAVLSTIETGHEPIALATADWNQDGHLDLAVANHRSDDLTILINAGDGELAEASRVPFASDSYPFMMAPGDFDGDTDEDLALVSAQGSGAVIILSKDGSGMFEQTDSIRISGNPYTIVAADFDGDGDLDLAAAKYDLAEVVVLTNEGGDFSLSHQLGVGEEPWSLASGDFDGDGDFDLASANEGTNDVSVLANDGSGGFTVSQSVPVGDEPYSIAAGDLDGDGNIDLVVANEESHDVSILTNDGSGTFAVSGNVLVGQEPWSVYLSNLDGDGDLDIITANADSDNVSIIINNTDT